MFHDQSDILTMLVEELRESQPDIAELFDRLENERDGVRRNEHLQQIGRVWQSIGGSPEVLAELGLALSELHQLAPGTVLAELLLAYGETKEQQRSQEWERHLMSRMAELKGLHRIISAANSTLALDTSMELVVETVAEVVNVAACAIYLYDRASNDLTLRATHGLNRDAVGQVRVGMGVGITGTAAQEGKPVSVRDLRRDWRATGEPDLGDGPFRAILAVPIVLFTAERFQSGSSNLLGVITIQTYDQREFSDEEVHFVETVAGELAFFISNAQLYQQTDERLHQKIRELTTLQNVSKVITQQLELTKVLKLIAVNAVELSHADRADIIHLDENGHLLKVASHGGTALDQIPEFIGEAVIQGRSMAVVNALNDSRYPELATVAAEEQFISLFCMPLHVHDHALGAICLYTTEERHFDFEQVRMLSTFADEAAIAIENARLYGGIRRSLQVKSAMLMEMHHRVRNNLQTVAALLGLQMRRLEPNSPGAHALRDSAARIDAMVVVHNLLSRQDDNTTTVGVLVAQLIDSAKVTLVAPDRAVLFDVCGPEIPIGSHEATALAIVLNECINNALYHGLVAEGGKVFVVSQLDDGIVTVDVQDDGPTHPAPEIPPSSSGLGLQLVRTLVTSDLAGTFELFSTDEVTTARIRFPHRVTERV